MLNTRIKFNKNNKNSIDTFIKEILKKNEIEKSLNFKVDTQTKYLSNEYLIDIPETFKGSELHIKTLFSKISLNNILKLFYYMLEERRIIVTGTSIFFISSNYFF
jgi:hypothetical protein